MLSIASLIVVVAIAIGAWKWQQTRAKARDEISKARMYTATCTACSGKVHPAATTCRHCFAPLEGEKLSQ